MTAFTFFFLAALIAMVGVLGSFLFGIVAMSKEGETQRKKSNKMMQMRVWLQGIAILLLFLAYIAK